MKVSLGRKPSHLAFEKKTSRLDASVSAKQVFCNPFIYSYEGPEYDKISIFTVNLLKNFRKSYTLKFTFQKHVTNGCRNITLSFHKYETWMKILYDLI